MSQDFYRILGVPRSATKEQIRNAYIGLARKYHPDINRELETVEQLKEVNHAYNILSDDETRAAYNLALRESDPSGLTNKLFSFRYVAVACTVTAALGTTLGYGLTFVQPNPVVQQAVAVTPLKVKVVDPDVIERKALQKALEIINESPPSPISSISPVKQPRIPITATIVMDKKRPLLFISDTEAITSSSTKELSAVKSFRVAPLKRDKKVSKRSIPLHSPTLAKTKTGQDPLIREASSLEPAISPSLRVQSSPEAILSTIPISMEDGSSIPADILLKVDTRIWKLNHGIYRKKLSKFISALVESKDVALASKQSGLSLDEIRYLVKQA